MYLLEVLSIILTLNQQKSLCVTALLRSYTVYIYCLILPLANNYFNFTCLLQLLLLGCRLQLSLR